MYWSILTWLCTLWQWLKHGWPAEYVPPLIGLAVAIWGMVTYYWSKNREQFKLGIDLILKLGERFDAAPMRIHRAAGARAILSKKATNDPDVSAVLDFFEEVAFLVRRGAVDVGAVYTYFSYWLDAYSCATHDYRSNSGSKLVWEEIDQICASVEQYEDWSLSRRHWHYRWRAVHRIAWHLWRKRDVKNRWGNDGSQWHVVMVEECKLVPLPEPSWAKRHRSHSRHNRPAIPTCNSGES